MRKIIIADRTVVLKSQSKDTSLSFKEKVEIARLLESAKVQVVEFPAIENVKIDTLLLKTICAFLKNSIHILDWPMPPPMVYGSSPASNALWNGRPFRSEQPRISSCFKSDASSTLIPILESSNAESSTGL